LAQGSRWAAAELLVSRGRCRFGRFDLSRVPAAKRGAALALQLGEWSPFTDFDHAVAWTPGGRAMVWCWDQSALQGAWLAASSTRMPPAVPESALRPPAADGGVRLLKGIDGFEAQSWHEGELVTSRWWPSLPSDGDARMFLRDAGLAASDVGHWLTPQDLPLAQRPWAPLTRAGRSGESGGLAESAVYALLLTSVLIPASVLGVDESRLRRAQVQVTDELQRESERSKAVLDARNAALTAVDQAQTLIDLQPYPPPLMQMSAVATELPAAATTNLREWQMTDGKLRVLFESPAGEISGAEHVRALERAALFDDVKIVTQADPRQMAFQMTLRKRAALGAPASAASAASPAAR
jgi:hypothetical protein